jgi:hypothetical protein
MTICGVSDLSTREMKSWEVSEWFIPTLHSPFQFFPLNIEG